LTRPGPSFRRPGPASPDPTVSPSSAGVAGSGCVAELDSSGFFGRSGPVVSSSATKAGPAGTDRGPRRGKSGRAATDRGPAARNRGPAGTDRGPAARNWDEAGETGPAPVGGGVGSGSGGESCGWSGGRGGHLATAARRGVNGAVLSPVWTLAAVSIGRVRDGVSTVGGWRLRPGPALVGWTAYGQGPFADHQVTRLVEYSKLDANSHAPWVVYHAP